jgi:hypothetical protein
MISAFAARQRVVLGQIKVVEKSNEMVAIPKLLDLLALRVQSSASTRSAAGATSPRRSSITKAVKEKVRVECHWHGGNRTAHQLI